MTDIEDITLHRAHTAGIASNTVGPSALVQYMDIKQQLKNKKLMIFLDYDGTLTPIVDQPGQAELSEPMRNTLRALAQHCPVAIISGRDRADIEHAVGIDTLFYAGSHGFDIAGPPSAPIKQQQGVAFLPALDHAEKALRQKSSSIPGIIVERKKFSIAVHFRSVANTEAHLIEDTVDAILRTHVTLRKGVGERVFELQPRLNWNKGKAVLWFLDNLQLNGPEVLPLYIGDGRTDEDAFQALENHGLGILVTQSPRRTAASYVLKDPAEVQEFLQRLRTLLEKRNLRYQQAS